MEVSGRGSSSLSKTNDCVAGLFAGFPFRPSPLGSAVIFTSTGTVSSLNLSAARAATAFLWESTENWSAASREMPNLRSEVFGAQAHIDVGVGIVIDEPRIRGNLIAAHRHERHGFRATRDDDLCGTATNAVGGQGDGLQAAGAEAIHGHGGSFYRQSGAKGGDARDVHALFAFGHGAAEDDVVNFFGIEARDSRKGFLDDESGEIVGAGGTQRTFVAASYRGSDGRNNDGFGHDGPRFVESFRFSRWWTGKSKCAE